MSIGLLDVQSSREDGHSPRNHCTALTRLTVCNWTPVPRRSSCSIYCNCNSRVTTWYPFQILNVHSNRWTGFFVHCNFFARNAYSTAGWNGPKILGPARPSSLEPGPARPYFLKEISRPGPRAARPVQASIAHVKFRKNRSAVSWFVCLLSVN